MKAVASAALVLMSLVAFAKPMSARASIQKWDSECARLLKEGKFDEFSAKLKSDSTSDFQYIEAGKTEDLDTMLAGIKASMGMMGESESASAKVLKIWKTKDGLTTVESHQMTYRAPGPDGKKHHFTYKGKFTDEWRMEDGKWKLAKLTVSATNMYQDGKLMDMSKMPEDKAPATMDPKDGADGGGPFGKGGGK
jgi:hypothetical protein